MGDPCLVTLLVMVFFPVVLVAILQRPPLTERGRIFYALAGVLGLTTGGHWLFWLATAHGYGSSNVPPTPLLDSVEKLFTSGDSAVWLACACCAAGIASCLWAMFGPEHREAEEE